MPPGTWLNAAIPGAGLVLRGRLALGLGFLLFSLFTLSSLILAQVTATSTALGSWRFGLMAIYLLLGCMATALHAVLLRERSVDAEAMRAHHRLVASAHLQGRSAEALAGAQRLAEMASGEPGAWRLLAVMAEDAGETKLAVIARRRAVRIDSERQL